MHLQLVTIIVDDYDPAIAFFVDALGFELAEDSPSTTNDGRPKRWVVVRPPGAQTGILLARADGPMQEGAVGQQMAGRGADIHDRLSGYPVANGEVIVGNFDLSGECTGRIVCDR